MEPSTGSSVIVEPPKAEGDGAGELLMKAEGKEKSKVGKGKWKIIVLIVLLVAILGGVITWLVMATGNLGIDYSSAYKTAKEVRVKMQEMRSDYGCQKVLDYVDSQYVTLATFTEYVEGCRTVGDDSQTVVEDLGATDGVRRNEEILHAFELFDAAYLAAISGGEELKQTLDLYTTWHKWVVTSAALENWDQTDADLAAAAKILTESGNDALKAYGEGWLTRKQAAAKAYREYYAASYTDEHKDDLRKSMQEKQKEFTDFNASAKPNIKEVQPLETADTAKLYARFEELYNLIKNNYEEHYNRGSGDCKELLNEVVCD